LTIYSDTQVLAIGSALGTILLFLAGLLALFAALMLQAIKELLRGGVAELARELQGYAPGSRSSENKQ
jgi:hypothetical protein